MSGLIDAKRELRSVMRAVRRAAAADPGRSHEIVARLERVPELARARSVMLFEPVRGEPDLGPLAERLGARGVTVVTPEPGRTARHPVAPQEVDVVVVPGLAFTRDGDRLGQGGGWYDSFLAGVRADCTLVGVCFDEQLVDALPIEPHDVAVTYVITPTATFRARAGDGPEVETPGSSPTGR